MFELEYVAIVKGLFADGKNIRFVKFSVPENVMAEAMGENTETYKRTEVSVAQWYYLNEIDFVSELIFCTPLSKWGGEWEKC